MYITRCFFFVLCIREKYVVKPPKMPKCTLFFSMNLLQVKDERYHMPS